MDMEYKRQHQNGFGEETIVLEWIWRIGDCIRTDLEKRYSVSKLYEYGIESTGYGYEMCPEVADLNSGHGKINGKYKK